MKYLCEMLWFKNNIKIIKITLFLHRSIYKMVILCAKTLQWVLYGNISMHQSRDKHLKKKIHQNSSRVSTCSYMLHASQKKITSKKMSQNKKVFYYYF